MHASDSPHEEFHLHPRVTYPVAPVRQVRSRSHLHSGTSVATVPSPRGHHPRCNASSRRAIRTAPLKIVEQSQAWGDGMPPRSAQSHSQASRKGFPTQPRPALPDSGRSKVRWLHEALVEMVAAWGALGLWALKSRYASGAWRHVHLGGPPGKGTIFPLPTSLRTRFVTRGMRQLARVVIFSTC